MSRLLTLPAQRRPKFFVLIAALAVYFGGGPATPRFVKVLGAMGIAGIPIAMIMLQPDLGTVLVYGAILAAVLVAVGTRGRHLLLFAVLLGLASVLTVNLGILDEYQVDRWMFAPEAGGLLQLRLQQLVVGLRTGVDLAFPPLRAHGNDADIRWGTFRYMVGLVVGPRF